MAISVIILTDNHEKTILDTLDMLAGQTGNYEIIVVDGGSIDSTLTLVEGRAKIVSASCVAYGSRLNIGAAAATGDILFFLTGKCQLPSGSMLAIERNLTLLPQMVGGNFHLKFDNTSLFASLLTRFLKWWRYHGCYYGNSGLFVRKVVYDALGGFQPYTTLADYDFIRRMETYGPTLYLPETIISPAPNLQFVLRSIIGHILLALKLLPKQSRIDLQPF